MGEWETIGGIKIITSSVAWISKDAIYWAIKGETGLGARACREWGQN